MDEIGQKVQAVLQDIRNAAVRVGRDPESVQLVAATKFVEAPRVLEAVQAGVTICGENRLQEALGKRAAMGEELEFTWHFIGRLQRRKVKSMIGRFALIHSVESLEQAEEIDRRSQELGIQQPVLLEVNIGEEASKGGFSPGELMKVLPSLDRLAHMAVKGIMAIPPWQSNPESVRPYFRQLRELADHVRRVDPNRIQMTELSMGMSHDFALAIEEGATLVRIGSRIFGSRPTEGEET